MMRKNLVAVALVFVCALIFGPSAKAGYILDLTQIGGNVDASGSGTIDLSGLTSSGTAGPSVSFVIPNSGGVATGSAGSTPNVYSGIIAGPSSFGLGTATNASSGSGDYVGIIDLVGELAVPDGYVSGDLLSSAAIFAGQSFASLGVTPGTYEWTWGTDGSFTLDASVAPVPEPGSSLLFGTALLALVAVGWSRRRHP